MKEFFIENGYLQLNNIPNKLCFDALKIIKDSRVFGPNLFLNEEDFKKQSVRWGTNPKPGRNLTEKIDINSIINEIKNEINEILGNDFEVMFPKVICGVSEDWLPEYVKKETYMTPIPNLGAFIKEEYRDITYFHGADYHQDIIDYKNRVTDFVTLYIYLNDVNENDAPLHILPTSHLYGCQTFPHNLEKISEKNYMYNYEYKLKEIILTGNTGSCYIWHPCLLHGTQPTKNSCDRISLRFLVTRKRVGIDFCNDKILGDLKISNTRIDVDDNHVPIIRNNVLRDK